MRKLTKSSRERLSTLPEVFTQRTLAAMFSWDLQTASVYLLRWKNDGMISSLGARTGVYFNLEKNPQARSEKFMDALKYVDPMVVMVDASALHSSGVTTQIPHEIHVAFPGRRSVPNIDGVAAHKRPEWWFRAVHGSLVNEFAIPRLSVPMAIADGWAFDGWKPDPDDLDMDGIETKELEAAFSSMRIRMPDIYSRPDGRDEPGLW